MPPYAVRVIVGAGSLEGARAVRHDVFVEEQGVAKSIEFDGRDDEAVHVVVRDRDTDTAVGTARLRSVDGHGKAERVAVREAYRERGIGRKMMALLEAVARERGHDEMDLHAQTHVEDFYHGLGYETVSDTFEEAGIPHVEMRKRL